MIESHICGNLRKVQKFVNCVSKNIILYLRLCIIQQLFRRKPSTGSLVVLPVTFLKIAQKCDKKHSFQRQNSELKILLSKLTAAKCRCRAWDIKAL